MSWARRERQAASSRMGRARPGPGKGAGPVGLKGPRGVEAGVEPGVVGRLRLVVKRRAGLEPVAQTGLETVKPAGGWKKVDMWPGSAEKFVWTPRPGISRSR